MVATVESTNSRFEARGSARDLVVRRELNIAVATVEQSKTIWVNRSTAQGKRRKQSNINHNGKPSGCDLGVCMERLAVPLVVVLDKRSRETERWEI